MNDDKKFGNMSEAEFRDLQEAPLQKDTPAVVEREGEEIEDLSNTLANDIDEEIADADLDDVDTLDADAVEDEDNVPPGGFREILESDLDEPLSDGGFSHDHIHSPDMDAPDTPGEVDIEDLDEGDLEGTGIPADALLDPLEE